MLSTSATRPPGFNARATSHIHLLSVRTALRLMNHEVPHHHVETTVGKGKLSSVTFFHRHTVLHSLDSGVFQNGARSIVADRLAIPHVNACHCAARHPVRGAHSQQAASTSHVQNSFVASPRNFVEILWCEICLVTPVSIHPEYRTISFAEARTQKVRPTLTV